jgi:hypothetical protein
VTRRLVAVAASRSVEPLALAMLEDVVDLVAGMEQVEPVLAVPPNAPPAVREVVWPGMAVVTAETPLAVLDALARLGADEGAVVQPDAPDLPPLLLGKLHSALTSASVAACPSYDGSVVAVAARLPVAAWLRDAELTVAGLRAAAPARALHVGAGWHRIGGPHDLHRLDPGLEGWEATRALLGR